MYCPPDAPNGKFDPVKQKALQLGIPVRQHKSLKAPQVREEFVALKADLAILAFVTQIVPPPIFSVPRLGSNLFSSVTVAQISRRQRDQLGLDQRRNRNRPLLFSGWIRGIDTGPILLQKEMQVDPDDTTGSLYFNKIFPLGIEAIGEAVDLINKAGNPPRIVQDESKASYDPPCSDEHARIDWSKPAPEVYNLIRGCDPQPGAHTTYNGKMVRLFDARLQKAANSAPAGQVTGIGAEEISIALNGGTLTVKRMRGEGGKISGAEFARQAGLKVGDRLG